MIKSNDESSRDIVIYKGSHPGHSHKQALVNSMAIINSSNAVFKCYFKIQESAAASYKSVAKEELQLRKEELKIQKWHFKQEDFTIGKVIKLKKRLNKSEENTKHYKESARRRNQEQNGQFNRLKDLLVKLFKREGGDQSG